MGVGWSAVVAAVAVSTVSAQEPATRAEIIERAQAQKAADAQPYVPGKAETYLNKAEDLLTAGLRFHPYFQSAYAGGGFTLGAGYRKPVGVNNSFDVRGSLTFSGYKRVEAAFLAPRLMKRRARFSAIAGWREATQVGYYGPGTANSKDDRANYGFEQFYGMADLDLRPRRSVFVMQAGLEAAQWKQTPGSGSAPSIEEKYTPVSLPGLGSTVEYLHSHATFGIDTRPAPDYARRGTSVAVTFRDFTDPSGDFGFKQVDYEAIQHVPILRETWVLSMRAAASTTGTKTGQQIPFFMLPSIGGGSSLRGYTSWRFRDRNSLLLQAEWRVIVNRFLDMALFYDTGKVTSHTRDLDLTDLEDDYGIGFRFHGPLATPLRIEFARSHEGLSIVFSSHASF
jgi:outer membrane protein assembly factor BamA